MAMNLAPVVSGFTGELILFFCCVDACGYPREYPVALGEHRSKKAGRVSNSKRSKYYV